MYIKDHLGNPLIMMWGSCTPKYYKGEWSSSDFDRDLIHIWQVNPATGEEQALTERDPMVLLDEMRPHPYIYLRKETIHLIAKKAHQVKVLKVPKKLEFVLKGNETDIDNLISKGHLELLDSDHKKGVLVGLSLPGKHNGLYRGLSSRAQVPWEL